MTVLTKWLRHATPADVRRMRGLPPHPVHAAVMEAVTRTQRRHAVSDNAFGNAFGNNSNISGLVPSPHEERIMFLYSPTVAVLQLEAYLVYRKAQANLVVVDALYSPHPGRGHASQLLTLLETRSGGKTIAMMSTEDSIPFFSKRGYSTPLPFHSAASGLAQLMMTKYIWQEL